MAQNRGCIRNSGKAGAEREEKVGIFPPEAGRLRKTTKWNKKGKNQGEVRIVNTGRRGSPSEEKEDKKRQLIPRKEKKQTQMRKLLWEVSLRFDHLCWFPGPLRTCEHTNNDNKRRERLIVTGNDMRALAVPLSTWLHAFIPPSLLLHSLGRYAGRGILIDQTSVEGGKLVCRVGKELFIKQRKIKKRIQSIQYEWRREFSRWPKTHHTQTYNRKEYKNEIIPGLQVIVEHKNNKNQNQITPSRRQENICDGVFPFRVVSKIQQGRRPMHSMPEIYNTRYVSGGREEGVVDEK